MMAKEVVVYFTIEQITLRHQDTSLVNTLVAKKLSVNQRNEFNGGVRLERWKTSRETADGTNDYDKLFSLRNARISAK